MTTTGIKALRRLMMGAESDAAQGTRVAPTTYWRGIGTIQENREVIFPNEDVGIFAGTDRNYAARADSILQIENTEATFEQLPYIFEMGMHHDAAPTSDGGFNYAFPIASTDTYSSTDLATYTWEGGDNIAAVYFTHGFVRTFNLSGEAGGALMVNAEVFGGETAPTTDGGAFTVTPAIPTVTEILFSMFELAIDDVGAGVATTKVSNTLLSMNMAVTTGWIPVYTASGSIDFSFIKQTQPEIVVSLTFEHNASSVAEIAAWRTNTPRVIQLSAADHQTGTKVLTIDMVGRWDNFEKIGERDGNDIVTGNFRVRYNPSESGFYFQVNVINGLAALP